MDPDSGKIYKGGDVPDNLVEILEEQMTARQKAEMQVSPFDNRSELGKVYTGNRKERRRQAAIARREAKKARRGGLTSLPLDPPAAADDGEETFLGYYPDGEPVVSVGGQVKLGS